MEESVIMPQATTKPHLVDTMTFLLEVSEMAQP